MQNAMCMRFVFEENVAVALDTSEMDMNASEVCIFASLVFKICLCQDMFSNFVELSL